MLKYICVINNLILCIWQVLRIGIDTCIYFNIDWVIPKLKCQLNAANDEMVWFDWLNPVNAEVV